MDTEILDKLITSWNPHFQNPSKGRWLETVPRENYLRQLEKIIDLRQIVVLTGVRRAGKSTLIYQLMENLIKKGTPSINVFYLHLEDVMVGQFLKLGWQLLETLYRYYLETYNPQGKVYLFLDEIQGVKEFNRWLYSQYEKKEKIKFFISGSSRSLIESEAATTLTGRTVQIDVYPLNFYEYLLFHHVKPRVKSSLDLTRRANFALETTILHHLKNYFFEGGYPEIVLAKNEEQKRAIANGYYRDIVTRDVLIPYKIRQAVEVESLGLQVLADFTKTHTYSRLGKAQKLSVETVKSYLDYFSKAYLFFESRFFSYKTKETQDIQKPRKIYVVDNGMRNFNIASLRPDIGQCAENVVYIELKRKRKAVYYWKGKKEVDFVVLDPRTKPKLELYNVSYTNEPHQREVEGLVEGLKEFNLKEGTILTKNYAGKKKVDNKTIEFVPLWPWLIEKGDFGAEH